MSVPQPQETKPEVTEQKPNSAEYNFAQMRKQLEQERAARQQAEEKAAQLEKEAVTRKERTTDDDDFESSDEPYVDHKTLKRAFNKKLPNFKEELKNEVRKEIKQEIEHERRTAYLKQNADFNEVMQPEVIQKFAEKHPNIAEGFLALPESFERQKLLYESIKALGAHRKEEVKSIQSTVDQNRRGPYYRPTDVSSGPYAAAGNYTPSGMKDAYAKMQELKSKLRI